MTVPDRMYYRRPKPHHIHDRTSRLWKAERLLLSVAALLIILSVTVILRGVTTKKNNQQYAELHRQAESVATAAPALARMGMPDGSAITREIRTARGETLPDITLSAKYHQTAGEILPQMRTMQARNLDLCGWITISGVLDLPVVYRDNTFYLDHDFELNKSIAGTLFLDQNHPVKDTTQQLLIYGHNMRDGSMFGLLTHYQQSDFLKKHPFIRFSTLWEEEEYVIYAVCSVSVDPDDGRFVSFFTHPVFSSDREFEDYIARLKALSCHKTFFSVKPEDALLTLCTCVGDDRLIIAARRIRPTESKASLLSLY